MHVIPERTVPLLWSQVLSATSKVVLQPQCRVARPTTRFRNRTGFLPQLLARRPLLQQLPQALILLLLGRAPRPARRLSRVLLAPAALASLPLHPAALLRSQLRLRA